MGKRISDIEDRNLEMTEMEEEKDLRVQGNERTLQELSDSIRKGNMRIISIPEGEERQNGTANIFKQLTRTSQTCGKNWILESKEKIEHVITSIPIGLFQGTLY